MSKPSVSKERKTDRKKKIWDGKGNRGKKEEKTDAWTESGSSQVAAQWKSSIPTRGCEWIGSPLKVTRVFALRMRGFDVSLSPIKGRRCSLRVCFSLLLHAREPYRDNEKNCYYTNIIMRISDFCCNKVHEFRTSQKKLKTFLIISPQNIEIQ